MLIQLLWGREILNTDAVMYYDPYTFDEYFEHAMYEESLVVNPMTDSESLFNDAEHEAFARAFEHNPMAVSKIIVAYAAKLMNGETLWLRRDEYQQLIGNLRSKGALIVDATPTVLNDLKGV